MTSLLQQAFDPEAFRRQGHVLIDRLADYLQDQLSGTAPQVIPWQEPHVQRDFWQEWLEEPGKQPDFFQTVLDRSIHLHHPRYMGHQVNPPAPIAALAGLVSDLLNNGMAVYEMGMTSTAMEALVVRTVTAAYGWGDEAGGHLTSGGTLANLTALLAARRAKSPGDIWVDGSAEQLALMVSEEAHYCIDRSVRIMGWGSEGIIKVPADAQYRMRTDMLETLLEEETRKGKRIIAVVASACSTSTGSYDDLEVIAAFCRAHDLWMHVDGAHGAAAVFSPQYKHLVKGIEKADSVAMDFHKMLLVPGLATGLFFRERSHSFHTFSPEAVYLFQKAGEEDWYNTAKRTFECTKLMMSLKVFTLLQTYGVALWDEYVTHCYDLGQVFARIIHQHPNWELAAEPQSNIVCFRYLGKGEEELNALNARLRKKLVEEGKFYIVQTVLRGQTWLRVTLVNPGTKEEDLETLLGYLAA
ncbi:MAG: aminotransferase class V-fold PLP-dependent enzyme [Saprospirales bacterium]|nr:aminotransferase class V-fold PLP-dependent enzyme [Saprospirales bacterium]